MNTQQTQDRTITTTNTRHTTKPVTIADTKLEVLLGKLVAFPTVNDDAKANFQALRFAGKHLAAHGMHVRYIERTPQMYDALLASSRADNAMTPTVLLAAHIDVITADAAMFSLRKQDGRYLGRGVYDMKFAIAAYLEVVAALQHTLPRYNFAILLTSDEELGGRDDINGTRGLVKAGLCPQVVILPDGGENWQLETASNGYMHLVLEARGNTGHSSRPWLGDNAIHKLTGALHDLKSHFKDQGPDTDTLNIATIKTSDTPANQIPDYAAAEISLRLRHAGRLAHWQRTLAEICSEHDITLTEHVALDVIQNDLANPFVRRFAELTQEEVGITVDGFHSYAASDARFFAEIGVPYINTYPHGGGHHSANEWLSQESLTQFRDSVLRYIREVAVER